MLEKIKSLLPVLALIIGAIAGYSYAANCYEREIAELQLAQAQAVRDAQNSVRIDYERRMQNLSASLERVRSDNALRMRQLENFNHARTDLESCRRDRSRLARLAVRGEELLHRADSYLSAIQK